jgi:acyl carrier protein
MTDRNVQFMKETWGTTSLVTDYKPEKKKLLREVTDEKFKKEEEVKETELFDAWDYGLDSLTLNS